KFSRPVAYLCAIVAAAVLSVAIFAGAQFFAARRASEILDNPASAEAKPSPDAGVNQLKQTSESFRYVAKIVGPAVVNIKSTKGAKKPMRGQGPMRRGRPQPGPGPDDDDGGGMGQGRDPFFDFFEKFGHPFMQPETPQTSLGSGIIIDKKGYV